MESNVFNTSPPGNGKYAVALPESVTYLQRHCLLEILMKYAPL